MYCVPAVACLARPQPALLEVIHGDLPVRRLLRWPHLAIGNTYRRSLFQDVVDELAEFIRAPLACFMQHSDQEHREGDSSSSAAVKSKVNADRKDQEVRDGFSIEGNLEYDYLLYEITKFGINSRCDCCTAVSRHPHGALVPPGILVSPSGFRAPWVLRVLSVVLLRI